MTDREIMQRALEALKSAEVDGNCFYKATELLRTRLAQPEQEPVAIRQALTAEQIDAGRRAPWGRNLDAFTAGVRFSERAHGIKAQPEQEPVAWEDVLGAIARGWTHDDNKHKTMDVQLAVAIAKEVQDMVIAPPQRKPLTDEDLRKLADKHLFYQPEGYEVSGVFALARAIEAAHGIKVEA